MAYLVMIRGLSMNLSLPEGVGFFPRAYTPEELREAAERGTILQATAVLCDERHDLHVELGCRTGRIARKEAALGIADGSVRDIAILSRVGKPVCFRVLSAPPDGELVLSRRAAQEQALSALLLLPPGTVLPAVVTSCAGFGAFCDIGCGVPALLGLERICTARLRHPAERFTAGQRIFAAIESVDPLRRRVSLTHRELLGTWKENAALFRQGQTVTGIVRGVQDYGIFVELTPNLSGLADRFEGLQPGDAVSVYIKSIQPERGKIKLSILHRLAAPQPPKPLRYFKTSGSISGWQYRD